MCKLQCRSLCLSLQCLVEDVLEIVCMPVCLMHYVPSKGNAAVLSAHPLAASLVLWLLCNNATQTLQAGHALQEYIETLANCLMNGASDPSTPAYASLKEIVRAMVRLLAFLSLP